MTALPFLRQEALEYLDYLSATDLVQACVGLLSTVRRKANSDDKVWPHWLLAAGMYNPCRLVTNLPSALTELSTRVCEPDTYMPLVPPLFLPPLCTDLLRRTAFRFLDRRDNSSYLLQPALTTLFR